MLNNQNCKPSKTVESIEIITGHGLCDKVLSHPDGGVEALIDLAGGQETDWLEFKAAPWPIGNIEKGLNQVDYHWHIAKTVLAMANSRGGCVLVGISEPKLEAVDLRKDDPRELLSKKGADVFLRYMRRVVEPDSGTWKCQKAGNWKINGSLSPLLRMRFFPYFGFDIVAILVNPLPTGANLITASRQESVHPTLFFRRQGNFGEIGHHSEGDDQAHWKNHRIITGSDISGLWHKFTRGIGATPPLEAPPEGLEDRIDAYHALVCQLPWYKEVVRSFTELECLERTISIDVTEEGLDFTSSQGLDFEAQEWLADGFDLDEIGDIHPNNPEEITANPLNNIFSENNETNIIDFYDYREPRKGNIFKLLNEEPQSIVSGEPGSGKSTSLRRLLLQSIRDYKNTKTITLYIPLAGFSGNLIRLISKLTTLTQNDIIFLIIMKR